MGRGTGGAMGGAKGSALLIAILLLALAGVVAAGLAELGRLAIGRARVDRDGVRAWFVAEAALADAVAAIPPGHQFSAHLRSNLGPPRASGAPWTSAIGFVDDADDHPNDIRTDVNARVMLDVNAFGAPPVRRRLEAVLVRSPDPWLPGAVTSAGEIRTLTPDFSLDGRDFDVGGGCTMSTELAPRAGASLPEGAGMPILAGGQVQGVPSVLRGPAPDLAEVAAATNATRVSAGPLGAALGDAATPRFTIVAGDASVDAATTGVGALYVTGRLRVTGQMDFRGLVAAAGGVDVAPGGALRVCGGLWVSGTPALDARGGGFVRASTTTLRTARAVAPLPALARIVATRELP
jgi:hypothetical protein